MALNKWACQHRDPSGKRCDSTAVGTGGAIGLRAIGWYFERASGITVRSPDILCPAHRPDPMPCRNPDNDPERVGVLCEECTADLEAKTIQLALRHGMDMIAAAATAAILRGETE